MEFWGRRLGRGLVMGLGCLFFGVGLAGCCYLLGRVRCSFLYGIYSVGGIEFLSGLFYYVLFIRLFRRWVTRTRV